MTETNFSRRNILKLSAAGAVTILTEKIFAQEPNKIQQLFYGKGKKYG